MTSRSETRDAADVDDGAWRVTGNYKVYDRFQQMLLRALATSMGLEIRESGQRPVVTLHITARDPAVLDVYDARSHELDLRFAAELSNLACDFIHRHTGVRLTSDE